MKYFIPLLMVISLVACTKNERSKLLTKKISSDNIVQVTEELSKDKLITFDDLRDFKSGFQILGQVEDSLNGKTVEDIINYTRDLKISKESADIINIANIAKMNYSVTVQATNIKPQDGPNGSFNIITYVINNKTDKLIKELHGFVNVNTKGKNEIVKRFPVKLDPSNLGETLLGTEENQSINYPYNNDPNNQRDQFIRQNTSNLVAFWFPEKIVFEDGTTYQAKYNK